MVQNNALIVLWKGTECPNELMRGIAESFVRNGIATKNSITVRYMDEESMSNYLAVSAVCNQQQTNVEAVEELEAVKHAVVYIGTRFKDTLSKAKTSGNVALFALDLSTTAMAARHNVSVIGTTPEEELLTAIEILSNTNVAVPRALARKYHFNNTVMEIIKKVYNSIYENVGYVS